MIFPDLFSALALRCNTSPVRICSCSKFKFKLCTGFFIILTLIFSLIFSALAEIVSRPVFFAFKFPKLSKLAIEGLLELRITGISLRSILALSIALTKNFVTVPL